MLVKGRRPKIEASGGEPMTRRGPEREGLETVRSGSIGGLEPHRPEHDLAGRLRRAVLTRDPPAHAFRDFIFLQRKTRYQSRSGACVIVAASAGVHAARSCDSRSRCWI